MTDSESDYDSDSFHSASEGETFEDFPKDGQETEQLLVTGTPSDTSREALHQLSPAEDKRPEAMKTVRKKALDSLGANVPAASDPSASIVFVEIPERISSTPSASKNPNFKAPAQQGNGEQASGNGNDGWDDWGDTADLAGDDDDEADESGWEDWGSSARSEEVMEAKISAESTHSTAVTSSTPRLKSDNSSAVSDTTVYEMKTSLSSSLWDWSDLTSVVTSVGEGISSVVETSLGLPSPEDMAKKKISDEETANEEISSQEAQSSFGGFFAGIGSGIVTGSLDVLESIGKKTFEKLTVQKQGTEKRRFIFSQDEGQNLSDVLKELRDSQRSDDSSSEMSAVVEQKREITFINLFEKYGGFVHLEGLELLSDNYYKKLSPILRRQVENILKEAVTQPMTDCTEDDDFGERLVQILSAIGLPYNGAHLVECDKRCHEKSKLLPLDTKDTFREYLELVAELTAHSVQSIHKLGQLMLIALSPPSQKPIADLLELIARRISFLSNQYAKHLNELGDNYGQKVEELVTAVFLASNDAYLYVQQSLRLLRPLFILNRP